MKTLLSLTASAILAFSIGTATIATAGETTATGSFSGANDHITTGGVTIVKTADGGAVVILDTDFSLDGAPDPIVGFGKDGTFAKTSGLGSLLQNTGLQVFVVPASVDVDDFNEVYIWCEQFAVSLGVASITRSTH